MSTPLPTAQDVREMLEMLLGRDVTVETGADKPSLADGVMAGVFVDASLHLRALIVLDLSCSAFVGAAMGLIPAAGARAAVEDRSLTPALAENAQEVINVGGSLLNAEGAPHLRLDAVTYPGERPAGDVAGLVSAFVPRLDLKVAVAGYGEGLLSVVVP